MHAQTGGAVETWSDVEGPVLAEHLRLTSPDDFVKAGEAYFNPDATRIVFQAVPVPGEGAPPDEHYSMYVADLIWQGAGNARVPSRLENVTRVSPEGSANTCGWFHPTDGSLLFGSTLVPPRADDTPGYQRGTSTYKWAFPTEMEIVRVEQPAAGVVSEPVPTFQIPGYTAEGSYSPDGSSILYAQVDDAKSRELGRPDADLYVYDVASGESTPVVVADGYDGGPFFNADGTWICYRSDRVGDNQLQLFASRVSRDDGGRIAGATDEVQLTNNRHVNWAPFFHPSDGYLVYTTSEQGHFNYEVYALPFDPARPRGGAEPVRVTNAAGFDGLSVFTGDGRWMMWTSQRSDRPGGRPGSSQLWIARAAAPRAVDRPLDGPLEGGTIEEPFPTAPETGDLN